MQSQSPRARVAAKRGGDAQPLDHSETVNLDEIAETRHRRVPRSWRWIRALDGLARVDARKARVIELRFFGGLSVEETAEVLQISPQSVMRRLETGPGLARLRVTVAVFRGRTVHFGAILAGTELGFLVDKTPETTAAI